MGATGSEWGVGHGRGPLPGSAIGPCPMLKEERFFLGGRAPVRGDVHHRTPPVPGRPPMRCAPNPNRGATVSKRPAVRTTPLVPGRPPMGWTPGTQRSSCAPAERSLTVAPRFDETSIGTGAAWIVGCRGGAVAGRGSPPSRSGFCFLHSQVRTVSPTTTWSRGFADAPALEPPIGFGPRALRRGRTIGRRKDPRSLRTRE